MSRAFKPDSTRMKFVLKGFKISDMDQVILALIFDFGLKKMDIKFSFVFIRV